jgi:5'-3' exonuclease
MNKRTELSFQILQINKKIKKYLKIYDVLLSLNDKELLLEVRKRIHILDKKLEKAEKELDYLEEKFKNTTSILTKNSKIILLP